MSATNVIPYPPQAAQNAEQQAGLGSEVEKPQEPSRVDDFWATLKTVGNKVYDGIDTAAEAVAEFVGLNESKYQDELDDYEKQKEREDYEMEVRHREANERIAANLNAAEDGTVVAMPAPAAQ